MAPVLPLSMKNAMLIRGTTFFPETYNHFARCKFQVNSTSNALSFNELHFPHLVSLRLFSRYRRWSAIQPKFRVHNVAANGAEETVEETVSAGAHEDANESLKLPFVKSETPLLTAEHCIKPHAKSNRPRPLRKSEMPPVKNEEFRVHNVAANGAEETVEETVSAGAHEDANESLKLPFVKSETPLLTAEHRIKPHAKSNRPRPLRKSEMLPVKNEELIPGATFTGKVRSIQPFGAFVDIGAFTEGLIHISNLSDSYVTDVKSIVSIGQEVKVRIVEASVEKGRISLTLRESNGTNDLQQKKNSSSSNNDNNPSPARRNPAKKTSSKFVKGQELEGTIRKFIRVGSFISLPEGEEGFLPKSEEVVEDFENMMGGSSLQVGQEIRVRVLYVTKEQVTLTMKKVDDIENLSAEVYHGVIHEATNPFVLAFRNNKAIAKFLDEREKWT
ncbi:30S Ribosomal protein S1 [Thalictrum thalictroides]|uniref:30S Ribosomal protein S1 n=1 Tax=Thalictrum thalictroides TaxID=46969 RepID=A0A7J6V1X6_THATH|nr:30S Ribosomal protein S1 [Thalictrum thalictroides]